MELQDVLMNSVPAAILDGSCPDAEHEFMWEIMASKMRKYLRKSFEFEASMSLFSLISETMS